MRMILLGFAWVAVCGAVAQGEGRQWTISYTTQAELVAVKGDTVFLKASDGVQSVPLGQLSESDRQFVASLAMAPIEDKEVKDLLAAEELPAAQVENGFVEPAGFVAPQNGPALAAPMQPQGGERSMLVSPAGGAIRQENYETTTLPSPAVVPNQNSANQGGMLKAAPQNMDNGRPQPQLTAKQQKAQQKADRKRAEADARPGLFGARQRRLLGGRD